LLSISERFCTILLIGIWAQSEDVELLFSMSTDNQMSIEAHFAFGDKPKVKEKMSL